MKDILALTKAITDENYYSAMFEQWGEENYRIARVIDAISCWMPKNPVTSHPMATASTTIATPLSTFICAVMVATPSAIHSSARVCSASEKPRNSAYCEQSFETRARLRAGEK